MKRRNEPRSNGNAIDLLPVRPFRVFAPIIENAIDVWRANKHDDGVFFALIAEGINRWSPNGHPDITPEHLKVLETSAQGHSDYVQKFALRIEDMYFGYGPKRLSHVDLALPQGGPHGWA